MQLLASEILKKFLLEVLSGVGEKHIFKNVTLTLSFVVLLCVYSDLKGGLLTKGSWKRTKH